MIRPFLLVSTLFIASCVFAQERIGEHELDLINHNLKMNPLLVEGDPDFGSALRSATVTSTPAGAPMLSRWADESAVILCQKTTFDFDKKGLSVGTRIGRNIVGLIFAPLTLGTSIVAANMRNDTRILVEETDRKRILLQDKFAIENYSVLYFRFTTDGDAFAARVIKKDGTVQPVELDDAVRVEDARTVPQAFRSYTEPRLSAVFRPSYYKVVLPDLQEGDIVEYQFRHYNPKSYNSNPQYKEFDPVYYLCNRELPVVRQIIEVNTENDNYFVTFKSSMGAPDFTETTQGDKKVYRWTDDDRDKLVDARYIDDLLVLPAVKFQVVYARSRSHDLIWFNSPSQMKSGLSIQELSEKAKAFWFQSGKVQNTGDYAAGLSESISLTVEGLYKLMKQRNITDESEDEYVRKAYYTIRGQTLYNSWSDYAFAKVFSGLLAKRKINHDIVVTSYNSICNLDQVAFTQDLSWVIRYKGKYYANPEEHGNPEDVPAYLNGNACVSFSAGSPDEPPKTGVIPLSDTTGNVVITTIHANLGSAADGTLSDISVDKVVQAKGLVKGSMEDDALALTPFMETDFRNYDGSGMWDGMPMSEQTKAISDFNEQKKTWKEDKPKMMKAAAESEYNATVEKYNDFKLEDDGRSYKKPALKYSESFVLGGLTATAGDDILLSLPSLIGSQPRIKPDERARTLPIDVRYARTVVCTISFPVPAGYTVLGLARLNRRVDNACGSFTSTAKVLDGVLEIDVRKLYKRKNMDLGQWGEFCAVLDEAYSFSQAKIVLRKGS